MIFMVNPKQAILFIIVFLVLQQIEGNLIYPHVVGESVGLPSIWVLAAVTIGGNLMGIVGMLVFIPLVSVLYYLSGIRISAPEKKHIKQVTKTEIRGIYGGGNCIENYIQKESVMKTRKKFSAKLLAIMLIAALLLPLAWNVPVEAAEAKQMNVLFSHDTHSHLNSFSTIVDGEQKEVGGFARIKTLINEKKQEDPDTLVLDGGDFSMGTLIQTVYETEAAELRMLGYLGYDVTTLGNHEYDYRSKGLANMLEAAKASGDTVPALVVCNVDWDSMEQDGLSDGQKQIRSAFEAYGVKDYVVVQKGDVKAAVVGVFGKDALECAPTCELKFKDPVEAVKQTVEEIRKNEKVDMIACVSHGGTWEDENKSEDEILAKEVPDID